MKRQLTKDQLAEEILNIQLPLYQEPNEIPLDYKALAKAQILTILNSVEIVDGSDRSNG